MTQKTKLEIIGEYRKDHPGPFCTRDGRAVRIVTHTEGSSYNPIIGIVDGSPESKCWDTMGKYFASMTLGGDSDLMCAREVPVPREFWIVEYMWGKFSVYESADKAEFEKQSKSYIRTFYTVEVLPGEGA